jgi:hypothetical protein
MKKLQTWYVNPTSPSTQILAYKLLFISDTPRLWIICCRNTLTLKLHQTGRPIVLFTWSTRQNTEQLFDSKTWVRTWAGFAFTVRVPESQTLLQSDKGQKKKSSNVGPHVGEWGVYLSIQDVYPEGRYDRRWLQWTASYKVPQWHTCPVKYSSSLCTQGE